MLQEVQKKKVTELLKSLHLSLFRRRTASPSSTGDSRVQRLPRDPEEKLQRNTSHIIQKLRQLLVIKSYFAKKKYDKPGI